MDTFTDIRQAMRAYGASSLGALTTPRVQPWSIPIDFSSNIAAAGSDTKSANNENGYFFFVLAMNLAIWAPSATGNTVANTPAYNRSDTGNAAAATNSGSVNTWMALSMFTLSIRTPTAQWFANPVRANLICGDGLDPGYRLVPIPIGPGQPIQATLVNNSAVTVNGQLLLDGYRLQVN